MYETGFFPTSSTGTLPLLLSLARNIRRHPATKLILSTPRRLSILGLQKLNNDVFAIEIHEKQSGFFAIMQLVLFVLKHCDERRLIPQITARGGLYGEPTGTVDWFAQLFVHRQTGQSSARRVRFSRVRSISDLGFRTRYESTMTLPNASSLFYRNFEISHGVLSEVSEICSSLGITARTLGVHFRGTDKKSEARAISTQEMISAIRATLHRDASLDKVLLATDEASFQEALIEAEIGVPVIGAPMRYQALAGQPVHFSGHPGLSIGREALVTCLLLSRCGRLLKTASYLSAWAKVFNPDLPVQLLSDARYFPDHALWKSQAAPALDDHRPTYHH